MTDTAPTGTPDVPPPFLDRTRWVVVFHRFDDAGELARDERPAPDVPDDQLDATRGVVTVWDLDDMGELVQEVRPATPWDYPVPDERIDHATRALIWFDRDDDTGEIVEYRADRLRLEQAIPLSQVVAAAVGPALVGLLVSVLAGADPAQLEALFSKGSTLSDSLEALQGIARTVDTSQAAAAIQAGITGADFLNLAKKITVATRRNSADLGDPKKLSVFADNPAALYRLVFRLVKFYQLFPLSFTAKNGGAPRKTGQAGTRRPPKQHGAPR